MMRRGANHSKGDAKLKRLAATVAAVALPAWSRVEKRTQEGKRWFLHSHHDVQLPHHTNADGIEACDGNQSAAHVAYAMTDIAVIYPITPATPLGEVIDVKAAAGAKNCFNQTVSVIEMQSEGGVAGALHGAISSGALATSFTCSQGLLLMIPNMYKIAGQLLPAVIHVACRSLGTHGLNLQPDHQDIMAVRQTGWTILFSETPQMCHDMAILAHIGTMETSVPVIHAFDGFRTSHEINKVELSSYEDLKGLLPTDAIRQFRETALTPLQPTMRGMALGQEVFFAAHEAGNPVRDRVVPTLARCAERISAVTGRSFAFYAYEGAPDAEHVVVLMGSACLTVESVVKSLTASGRKVGVLKVRLFRPFASELFAEAIPTTAKTVTVLDRSSEPGASGEALYLEVVASLRSRSSIQILKGRYGIGGKEFTPAMAQGVLDNMAQPTPKDGFTVGVVDDVTFKSLPYPTTLLPFLPPGTKECLFYGLGSDGTLLANKIGVKIINRETPFHAQAYFQYDGKKSGSLTVSNIRFGPEPINAPFAIQSADYIGLHRASYITKYDVLKRLKKGGIVVINCGWSPEEVNQVLPARFRRKLAELEAKVYFVNADKVAQVTGLGKTINMIMQAAFFRVMPTDLLPYDDVIRYLIEDIKKSLHKKDESVLRNNEQAINLAARSCVEVPVQKEWLSLKDGAAETDEVAPTFAMPPSEFRDRYMENMDPLNHFEGDEIPVSHFTPGGRAPTATSWKEKRGIALQIPKVDMSKCIQCGKCSVVCPHAAIRPFLLTGDEAAKAPAGFACRAAEGAGLQDYQYRIQVSPLDCTGCEHCSRVCPAKAIDMVPAPEQVVEEKPRWAYATKLSPKGHLVEKDTLRGSQFQKPLFEFSAACEGCGETPYIKLLTQLLGDRLVVANATGCSSVYASWTPSVPYTVNEEGRGPAWGNSLFEDNAEYGFGMRKAFMQRRKKFVHDVEDALGDASLKMSEGLRNSLEAYLTLVREVDHDRSLRSGRSIFEQAYQRIVPLLAAERFNSAKLDALYKDRQFFTRISFWTIGGDGWAYDIGFSGLDHVLHSGEHAKIMVLDTEVYSNTGGQMSKATPTGAQVKFAELGKEQRQKDLGVYAMGLRSVYVASVCLLADPDQAHRALLEAEAYPGPSLVICYSPCIAHGYKMSETMVHCREAVDSGYWPLYRYNPELAVTGLNPFQLDSKRVSAELLPMMKHENRFSTIIRADPGRADQLLHSLQGFVTERNAALQKAIETFGSSTTKKTPSSETILVAYGSETGNSEDQAQTLAMELKNRGKEVRVTALDDIEVSELQDVKHAVFVISTCGAGEFPRNSRRFWSQLQSPTLGTNALSQLSYAVFGLGDSHYCHFCEAAILLDRRLKELGARALVSRGVGDDQDPDRYHTGWDNWSESSLYPAMKATDVVQVQSPYQVQARKGGKTPFTPDDNFLLPSMKKADRVVHKALSARCHHHEFAMPGAKYRCGDTLLVQPANHTERVDRLLGALKQDGETELSVSSLQGKLSFPAQLTVRQLFTYVLDIQGRPNKRFLQGIDALSPVVPVKDCLAKLPSDFYDFVDVMELAKPNVNIGTLMSLIPRIKPRAYSISSSPKAHPDSIELTTVRVSWEFAGAGKEIPAGTRYGLCSNFLAEPRKDYWVRVQPGSIHLPSSETPLILVGLGTGIAPWRAVIQDRAEDVRRGGRSAPIRLYFGVRGPEDFLYRAEFEAYAKAGLIDLRYAYSDNAAGESVPRFVTTLLEEDGKVLQSMMSQGGHFFLCGPSRVVPTEVRNAMKRVVMCNDPHVKNEADAEAVVESWRREERYHVEAFS